MPFTKRHVENIDGSFIYDIPKPETTQVSINRWMDKQIVKYYTAIMSDTRNKMNEYQKHITQKKSD